MKKFQQKDSAFRFVVFGINTFACPNRTPKNSEICSIPSISSAWPALTGVASTSKSHTKAGWQSCGTALRFRCLLLLTLLVVLAMICMKKKTRKDNLTPNAFHLHVMIMETVLEEIRKQESES